MIPSPRLTAVLAAVALVLTAVLVGCHSGQDQGSAPKAAAAYPAAPAQVGLPGDLNGNGQPDVADAIGILRIVVGLDVFNPLADCDGDGNVGVADAIALLRCVVGFDEWPIGGREDPVLGDEKVGSDGQTLVWVPEGSFPMGSNTGNANEQPVHTVTIDGFWIGKFEVTNNQYAAFLNAEQPAYVGGWIDVGDIECGIEYVGGSYQARAGRGNHPVVLVSWRGANAYCQRYGYTLPTEAQWEYAACGGTGNYPWGSDWDILKCCNGQNQGPLGRPYTFEVGSFPLGASWCNGLDFAGNVFEWCSDWYSATYYAQSPENNPTGPAEGDAELNRVVRGGSWSNLREPCRSQYRFGYSEGTKWGQVGFRVAQAARR